MRFRFYLLSTVSFFCLIKADVVLSGEVKFKKQLNATYSASEQTIQNGDPVTTTSVLLSPSLLTTFKGNHLDASLSLKESFAKSNDDQGDQNYSDIRLNSKLDVIENMLSFSITGNQSYRSVNQIDNLLNDELLPGRTLTRTRSLNTGGSFSIPNPKYFGLVMQATHSKSEANNTIDDGVSLDSSNNRYSARLYNGKYLNLLSFDFNALVNQSNRASNSNFNTTQLSARVGLQIISDIEFTLRGSANKYDTNGSVSSSFGQQETDSYGAGFRWSPANNRYIEISYNTFNQDDEKINYVGGEANWAFSNRTKLGFTYDKRFYGDAYKVNFDYNLKSFRSSVSYDESITTYARTTIDSGELGLFVCPIGSNEFIECFQPDTLDYVLQPGEEFRSFSGATDDITNDVFIRKNGRFNLSYQKRKIKASLVLGYLRSEYLESDRLQTNKTVSLNLDYRAGRKTNVGAAVQFVNRESGDNSSGDTISYNTTVTRKLTKNARLNIALRYLERDSNLAGADINDKRLTAGFNYTF